VIVLALSTTATARAEPPERLGALLAARVLRLHRVLELAARCDDCRGVATAVVAQAVEVVAVVEQGANAINPQPGSV
jgi:hypothetical protein